MNAPVLEKGPHASRVAARGAPHLAPPQRVTVVVEDRHDAASHRQASREDTRLGEEGRDPTEDRDREEEEAVWEEEAELPPKAPAEDPLGERRGHIRG